MRYKVCGGLLAGALLIMAGRSAEAQCPSLPFQLTNGQTADASQVMANFNQLANCLNSGQLIDAPTPNLNITNSNGAITSIQSSGAAASYNFNLPIGPGIAGQVLSSGGPSAPMTWINVSANGTGVSAPTIRGASAQASYNNQYTVTWPTGTKAGDFAILFAGHAWQLNTPIGWASVDNEAGANWNGAVFYRTLSQSDINTGYVTITAQNSYDGAIAIITFVGSTGGLRGPGVFERSGSTPISPMTLNSDGSPIITDVAIYFSSIRSLSTNYISLGIPQATANDGSAASATLNAGVVPSVGGVSPLFSYSNLGSGGFYDAVVFVKAPGT